MAFPCYFMIFLWDYYGMSIQNKLKSIENKFKLYKLKSIEKSIESKLTSIEHQLNVK